MTTNFIKEIDVEPNLKRELSMSLQDELNRQIIAGEEVLISLPGSFGEALAVSSKRVFVIRDADGRIQVNAYPLALVRGAQSISTISGGYIELELVERPSEPDQARVYFPSYDAEGFNSAAQAISRLTAPISASAPSPSGASPVASGAGCPRCGAPVEPQAAFCGQCSEQLRQMCEECGSTMPMGSKFCVTCGKKATDFNTLCHRCGARVVRGRAYCTECGAAQYGSCLACGSTIHADWTYCAYCGREKGAGVLDPRSQRGAMQRLERVKEDLRGVEERPTAPVAPAAPVSQQPTESAESYNERGRELFEAEDLEGAIREFRRAVELDPGNGSYHCNLAVAYDENEQDELAFQEYTRALQIDPNDITALLSMGYMYSERDEHDKATEVWQKILQIAPDTPEAQEVRQNLAHQGSL